MCVCVYELCVTLHIMKCYKSGSILLYTSIHIHTRFLRDFTYTETLQVGIVLYYILMYTTIKAAFAEVALARKFVGLIPVYLCSRQEQDFIREFFEHSHKVVIYIYMHVYMYA